MAGMIAFSAFPVKRLNMHGSSLDIFGGTLVKFDDLVQYNNGLQDSFQD